MLKHIVLTAAIVCAVPVISAQTAGTQSNTTTRTITGMVVDKNGNPLSGAEVRATGGAETVYTEADGSYSIEVPITLKSLTASYTGLRDTKLRTTAHNQMIFTLKEHRRTHGFINLVGGASKVLGGTIPVDGMIPQAGIMGGAYRKWGGYAKIMIGGFGGPRFDTGYGYSESFMSYGTFPLFTGGVIKRLSNNVNLLVGAGAGANYNLYQSGSSSTLYNSAGTPIEHPTDNYNYDSIDPESDWAIAVEAAVMFHYKKLNILAGVTYVAPCFDKYNESYSSRYDYTDGTGNYSINNWWTVDNDNKGNLNIFVSIGLHI